MTKFVEATTADSGGGQNDVTGTCDPGIGDNRCVVVGLAAADGNGTDIVITGVTFDGVAMTSVNAHNSSGGGGFVSNTIYMMLDEDLPVGGSNYNVIATATGDCYRIVMGMITLDEVPQSVPTIKDTDSAGEGTNEVVTTSVTVVDNNSYVLNVCAIYDQDVTWADTPTERVNYRPSSNADLEMVEKYKDSGAYAPSFTVDGYSPTAGLSSVVFGPAPSGALYTGPIDQDAMTKNTYVKIAAATVAPTENTLTVTISAEGSDPGDVVVADNIGLSLTPP